MGIDSDPHVRIGYSNPFISNARDLLNGSEKYEFFEKEQARKEIFLIGKDLTNYLHDQKIHQLVLVDRSARPVYIAVQEYWNAVYPDEKMPQIYFVDPQGFKSKKDVASMSVSDAWEAAELSDYEFEFPSVARPRSLVNDAFKEVYSELMKHKNEKVLLFDACIHSGDTIKPVLRTMKQSGFSKLKVGVVHDSGTSDISIAHEVLLHEPYEQCFPFHKDRMTNKSFSMVRPIKEKDKLTVNTSRRLRQEIRRIMKEQLQAKKVDISPRF